MKQNSDEIMVNLWDEIKDLVTGFKGIAVARSEFLYGCTRIAVQPEVDKEGKIAYPSWFDEPQLKILKSKKVKAVQETDLKKVGGPMPYKPTRMNGKFR